LGFLRNLWQNYGAVAGSPGTLVAALKEHPLTVLGVDVERNNPAGQSELLKKGLRTR